MAGIKMGQVFPGDDLATKIKKVHELNKNDFSNLVTQHGFVTMFDAPGQVLV